MSFHSVKDMLDQASQETMLDRLSPEEYVSEISNQLLILADEFPGVDLRVSRKNVPQFCADLRRGQLERLVEDLTKLGLAEEDLRGIIDPQDFEMPRRIETYAAIYASVELKLNAHVAHLLATDLARGVAARTNTNLENLHAHQN